MRAWRPGWVRPCDADGLDLPPLPESRWASLLGYYSCWGGGVLDSGRKRLFHCLGGGAPALLHFGAGGLEKREALKIWTCCSPFLTIFRFRLLAPSWSFRPF